MTWNRVGASLEAISLVSMVSYVPEAAVVTVTGTPGAVVTVDDPGAVFIGGDGTGTIGPDGRAVLYCYREFARPAEGWSGVLENTASVFCLSSTASVSVKRLDGEIELTPADITIYMGGDKGYEAVVGGGDESVKSSSLPEPLFHVKLPGGGSAVTMKTPEGTVSFDLALPALYNVCNAAAALTAARTMGWDMDICCAALADFGAVFGRMEQLTVGETSVRIVLVKNPAGCDRALEFLASQSEDVLPIFCLNDNAADGTDVSWIWDADYESLLAARRYASIGVYGVRAQDMRLRLKYAGADDAAITVYDTADDLAAAVQKAGKPVVLLPNYTSMLTVRDKLSALAGGGRFWE